MILYRRAAFISILVLFCLLLSSCESTFADFQTAVATFAPPQPAPTQAGAGDEPDGASNPPAQLPACIPPGQQPVKARVTFVTDGDTIHVEIDGQDNIVRYIGMDAPEDTREVEQYGPQATEHNRELVGGKTVWLVKDVSETDRYGRLLRYVFSGDVFVNDAMVRQGYANAGSYPPDVACLDDLRRAEDEARRESRGFWANEDGSISKPCGCTAKDLDCADFTNRAEAQACFDFCQSQNLGDVYHLDGEDQDGRVCETMN